MSPHTIFVFVLIFSGAPIIVISNNFCNQSYQDELWNTANILNSEAEVKNYTVHISEKKAFYLRPFWKSTGMCPPDPHKDAYKFLLSEDMEQNIFHIGSLPKHSITQIRIHWLLDMISIRVYSDTEVEYDFKKLDNLIRILWKNNLQPGFELMGNPSNYFTNFENGTQVIMWKNLVEKIAKHYISIFGIQYVMKWNFETWNEPDHHDFDGLNFTIPGFLNYYDACSEGLKAADKRLKFGGPGGSCRIPSEGKSPICWALLSHCNNGTNYFTKEVGVRLDFISFHKKGNSSTLLIFEKELETILYIRKKFPNLLNVSIYNDEADPLKNWSLSKRWRADVTYASLVVKIIISHINFILQNESAVFYNTSLKLISSDNAFLSYFPNQFTQRTLLARFQVNNTHPKHVEFVKKPVYSAFALLNQLKYKILSTEVYNNGMRIEDVNSSFGVLATENKREINIILYNVDDPPAGKSIANVLIQLNFSSVPSGKWVVFELNNIYSNPYLVWENMGSPAYPSTEQFYFIKNAEEATMRGPYDLKKKEWIFNFQILNPGVTLITICKTPKKLQKVQNIRFFQSWNFTLHISWSDKLNSCVSSYQIEYSLLKADPFHKINKKKFRLPSYWHFCSEYDVNCTVRGFYRVNVIDFWNNHGPYSEAIKF